MAAPAKKAKAPLHAPRIVAVTGGKGGVGKSVVACNLALTIGRSGQRVVLVDADLGAANLHTMLGITRPTRGLAEFFDHEIEGLEEARLPVAVPTVSLIPGTSRPGSANINHGQKLRLLRALTRLDADCVVIDVGAGSSFNVIDLVTIADLKLFVLNANLPSLNNAYALLKACVHRVLRKLSEDPEEQGHIDAALANDAEVKTVPQLLAAVKKVDSHLVDRVVDTLLRFGVGLVGNNLNNDAEANVLGRMSAMIYDHLLVHAPVMGQIKRSAALAGGLLAGSNTIADRGDEVYAAFRRLATAVTDADLDRLRGKPRAAGPRTMPIWIQREAEVG
jgi:flagellar biosynthesis protein FlhG